MGGDDQMVDEQPCIQHLLEGHKLLISLFENYKDCFRNYEEARIVLDSLPDDVPMEQLQFHLKIQQSSFCILPISDGKNSNQVKVEEEMQKVNLTFLRKQLELVKKTWGLKVEGWKNQRDDLRKKILVLSQGNVEHKVIESCFELIYQAIPVETKNFEYVQEMIKKIYYPNSGDFSTSKKKPNPTLKGDKAKQYCYQALIAMRSENYISAIKLATKALEIDKNCVKAYYRRAAAYLSLNQYAKALQDFLAVTAIHPNDKNAREKVEALRKEMTRVNYEKSVALTPTTPSVNINLDDIWNFGPAKAQTDDIAFNESFVFEMIKRFKSEKIIQKRYVLYLLVRAIDIFKNLPTIVHVDVPKDRNIIICGDTHGQFYDVCNIFEKFGYPSAQNPYVFNGDFVDRGSWGCEIVLLLIAFKILDPDSIHLNRGNHEDRAMQRNFGFEGECVHKFSREIYDLFSELFCYLPLGTVLNNRVFITHGGVGFQQRTTFDPPTLEELNKIDRVCAIPESGLMCDLLWSDPMKKNGKAPSDRGVSVLFGPDITLAFLERNKLDLVIRSHELKDQGYEVECFGRLITIFSAPNYVDYSQNLGAVVILKGSKLNDREQALEPEFRTFKEVPHPKVKPMAYVPEIYSCEDFDEEIEE